MYEILVSVVFISIYLLPTIVAVADKKRNSGGIFVLNLLLGWTVFGWIIALVWASCKDDPGTVKEVK